ncbi:MAG: flagellar assembly lytic transglycosylase [Treponemataceae bacterium]
MGKNFKNLSSRLFLILFLLFFCSLSVWASSVSANCFKALKLQEKGEFQKAQKCFEKSLGSKNPIEVSLALQKIFYDASASQKLAWTKKAIKSCKNPEIIVYNMYVQALLENKQYKKAIKNADLFLNSNEFFKISSNFSTFSPNLSTAEVEWFEYCKFCSILKLSESKSVLSSEKKFVQDWFSQKKFNEYHEKFWHENFSQNFQNSQSIESLKIFEILSKNSDLRLTDIHLFELRHEVFNYCYGKALKIFETQFSQIKFENLTSVQISDIGKTLLYGSGVVYQDWAKTFEDVATGVENEKFYFYFYAARLYEKAGKKYYFNAKQNFINAMQSSVSEKDYDNSLWYFLKVLQKESEKTLIDGIQKYGSTFKDKFYYSDLFYSVFLTQISQRQWTDFCKLKKLVDLFAPDDVKSGYYYLCARLLQENFVNHEQFKDLDAEKLFFSAMENPYAQTYYVMASAKRLKLPLHETIKILSANKNFVSLEKKKSSEVADFLDACLKHKNVKELYATYLKYKTFVGYEQLARYAKQINLLAQKNDSLCHYSLRLAGAAISSKGFEKDAELLKLFYPRFFYSEIKKYSKEYNIEESLLLGLIRSESFFDKNVHSAAGAVGLCQLMPSTAADIGRKLKKMDFDLSDPKTNIHFGTFYLSELIRRLDGSVMSALISYNSGISRVRSWHKKYAGVPIDIFIEMLPYEESRDYGKKIFTASMIYEYLYYGKTDFN